jgi:uncharacterized repeat protein (TIGR01451 family)
MGLGRPSLLAVSQTIVCDAPVLIANSPEKDAHLGWSLSADGEWLAAGANLANASGTDSGAVALYRNPQPGAKPTQEIPPPVVQAGDQFGTSVSISGDWLAVGAPVGDGKVRDSGVVYLFQFDGSTWVFKDKLDATDAAQGKQFGFSVSLSGTRLVAGAPMDSGRGSSAGAAYVFELQGESWTQTAKLLADDGRPFDEFGSSVAVAGNEIVVGVPFADDLHEFRNFGAAYVFKRTPNGGWTLDDKGKLTAADTIQGNNIQFGWSVAVRGDQIVVGAPGGDLHQSDSGSAYVFERTAAGWSRSQDPLTALDPGQSEQFGTAVLIYAKDRVLIGAPFDNEGGAKAGAAYGFEKQNGSWMQTFKIRHDPGGAFGQSVAILDDQVFLGGFQYDGPFEAGTVTDAGAVSVCPLGPPTPRLTCTKSGPTSVNAGETATYTVNVTNKGETAVTGVVLNDSTPAGLTFVRAARPCEAGFPCVLGTIGPHGSLPPVEVTFRVPDGCSTSGSFTNSAVVTGDGAEASTCSAPITSIVPPPPVVLSCEKQGPGSARPGDLVTYKVTVSNSGCAAAKNVMLSDVAPPGLTYVSGPCVQSPCNLGTIGPGQAALPVSVSFRVLQAPGCREKIVNSAMVNGNDVCSKETALGSELGVDVSAPANVLGGKEYEASVVVSNAGPATARNVPLDVTVVGAGSVAQIPAGCAAAVPNNPGHFTCFLAEVGCGGSTTLVFRIVAPACPACAPQGPITVTAKQLTVDADPSNDQDSAQTQVICPLVVPLTITKTDGLTTATPGQELLYTIVVSNPNSCTVDAVTVSDTYTPPEGLNSVRWCQDATQPCTPLTPLATGKLNTISLPAGSAATYRLRGIVDGSFVGTLINTATATWPAGTVSASDRTDVTPPACVKGSCDGIAGSSAEGGMVTYTFLLTNNGPADQADNPGDEFTDILPAGLTLVSASASSGTAATAGNTATWNGAIPVGGTVTITVVATINFGTLGQTICNPAAIAFDCDGNGSNESSATVSPACCFTVGANIPIPTLSGAGLAALSLLLAALALLRLRRRSP